MKKKKISKFDLSYLGPIAHRGYHNETATENGLKAFQNAIDNNLPFELDIHITKDQKLVVCHDSDLIRTTGKHGIIEELTFDEIRENYRLLDGGVVPSFEEVLELNQERVLIVVELKVEKRNYKPLAKAALKALAKVKNKKKIALISFDPRALIRVKKTGMATALLIVKSHEWVWHLRHLFDSIDIDKTMVMEPRVVRYHKRHIVNVWTLENIEEFKKYQQFADAFTFQHFDPKQK